MIAARIAERQAKTREIAERKFKVTTASVIEELAALAFSNMGDYLSWGPDGVSIVPSDALSRSQLAAVSKVTQRETTRTRDGETTVNVTTTLELHDKVAGLDRLGKHLGGFGPNDKPPEQPQTFIGRQINVLIANPAARRAASRTTRRRGAT